MDGTQEYIQGYLTRVGPLAERICVWLRSPASVLATETVLLYMQQAQEIAVVALPIIHKGTSAVAFLAILLPRSNSKLVYDLPESGRSVSQLRIRPAPLDWGMVVGAKKVLD